MNHDKIIKVILKHDGYIVGGYVREWLINNKPQDTGWSDIDIKCPKKSENKICEEIYAISKSIPLDFSPNIFTEYKNPYSCNLIKYDGTFKNVNHQIKIDFVDLANKKVCLFLKENHLGRILSFEKRLINQGWKIEFPFIKN